MVVNIIAVYAAVVVGTAVVTTLLKPSTLPRPLHTILSRVIHVYLCWRYPIKDQTGLRDLPTVPYSWPNGQGDVGKFLEGIENSTKWGKEKGQLYRIWSGMKSEIVLTKPKHVQAVFADSNKHFKAVNNNSGYIMGQLLGQCVGLISGDDWQTARAVTEVPFVHRNMAQQVSMIRKHVESYMKNLEDGENMRAGLIHPAIDLKFLSFWIIAEIFYGDLPLQLREWLQHLVPLREDLFKDIIRGGLTRFAIMRFVPTSTGKKLSIFKQQWQKFNQAVYEHCRESKSHTAPIVQMYEAAERGTISHEQLLQTIDEALFANLDVTVGGLSWNLVFLAADAECQEQLRAEALSQSSESVDNYLQKSSTYLAACVLESSRLKPLAAFSVAQSAPTDRVLDEYVIPANTDFIVDAYALNVRDGFWGTDAGLYNPKRFLAKSSQLRYNYWRFGFGPRQCMGKYVADLMIRAVLDYLMRNYTLSIRQKDKEWTRSTESWITHPDLLVECQRRQMA